MKKQILFVIIVFCGLCCSIHAKPVSSDEAREIAYKWYTFYACQVCRDFDLDLAYTGQYDEFETFYVFSPAFGGFVIVAADDAALPILGYSADAYFDPALDCPAVKDWLDNYSRQIAWAVKEGIRSKENAAQWDAIRSGNMTASVRDVQPLLTTTWGQGCYYNAQCPVDSDGPCSHVVTGCGPTAMAQIMKYYNHPPHGIGSNTYYHYVYGELSANFSGTNYDWNLMPDNLTTYNLAVAKLIYHAGVSVNVNYSANLTTCSMEPIMNAFTEYFNYHPEIGYHSRNDYPEEEDWKNLIKAELDEDRPVFYHGSGVTSGHYFICDGYQESGDLFHFNWGWKGNFDGWYLVNDLTPGNNDFNLINNIFTNLKPYNPDLVVRISNPTNHLLFEAGQQVDIEAATVVGDPDNMKLYIDDILVMQVTSETLDYTWYTSAEDVGSHVAKVWSIEGDDSVYYSINLNISDEWINQSSGFSAPKRAVSYISAVDSSTAWAIVRDGNNEWNTPVQEFTRTTDGGQTWISGSIPGCEGLLPGMICALSEDKAYVSMWRMSGDSPQGIYVTIDGGQNWTRQSTALFSSPYSFPDCIHFFDETHGWCMGDPYVQDGSREFEIYTTTDGGENWIAVPPENKPDPLTSEFGLLGYSAVNDTLWFGTINGRVYKSVDRGYSYTVTAIEGLEESWIIPVFRNGSHGLVHDFFNFGGMGKIYETFDGGATWNEIIPEGTLYRTDLAYVPGTENTWVSSGHWNERVGIGASVSFDGGHSWTLFDGTNGTEFRYMAWVNSRCGWAGSYNVNDSVGGMYKFCGDLETWTAVEEPSVASLQLSIAVYPNPASGMVDFRWTMDDGRWVTLKIYDVHGREVATALDTKLPAGEHRFSFDVSCLPDGMYFLQVAAGDEVASRKLVVLH